MHLNLSAVFTHRVFKSELIGLIFKMNSAKVALIPGKWAFNYLKYPVRNVLRFGYLHQHPKGNGELIQHLQLTLKEPFSIIRTRKAFHDLRVPGWTFQPEILSSYRTGAPSRTLGISLPLGEKKERHTP
jgi:hypothetical protein